jgi:hypothetical protein
MRGRTIICIAHVRMQLGVLRRAPRCLFPVCLAAKRKGERSSETCGLKERRAGDKRGEHHGQPKRPRAKRRDSQASSKAHQSAQALVQGSRESEQAQSSLQAPAMRRIESNLGKNLSRLSAPSCANTQTAGKKRKAQDLAVPRCYKYRRYDAHDIFSLWTA